MAISALHSLRDCRLSKMNPVRTLRLIATLMAIAWGSAPCLVAQETVAQQTVPIWSADQVAGWAAKHSPTANLLEAERAALAQSLDCASESQRAQIGLLQAVLRELALHQRQEAAADALDVYHQITLLQLQMDLLGQAAPRLESLEGLAIDAERLDLPDGDRDSLTDRRLELEDRWFQAEFGIKRLRNQLAEYVNQTDGDGAVALLVSAPPTADGISLDAETHIATALANRHDLKAIEVLCRCMTEDSLPAARQVLGSLVPGLGLQAAGQAAGCSLIKLHKSADDSDLGCRKSQCRSLGNARRDQIGAQVRDALLRLRLASSRLAVARNRESLKEAVVRRVERGVELQQQPPGSVQLAQLDLLEQQALVAAQQLEVAQAIVALARAKGTVVAWE
jgi:hypothetical protein